MKMNLATLMTTALCLVMSMAVSAQNSGSANEAEVNIPQAAAKAATVSLDHNGETKRNMTREELNLEIASYEQEIRTATASVGAEHPSVVRMRQELAAMRELLATYE